MDQHEKLANEIIDLISDLVQEHYPEIKAKCITDDKDIDNPALINGTVYYDLESEIAGKIKQHITGTKDKLKQCQEGFNILMEYWDSLPDEEKPKINKRLEAIGI